MTIDSKSAGPKPGFDTVPHKAQSSPHAGCHRCKGGPADIQRQALKQAG